MARILNDTELKRLHRTWRRETDTPLGLLLDRVNGPFNMGAMLRTAASLRVDSMFSVASDLRWTDVKVQKTAMGTHRFLNLQSFETAEEAIPVVQQEGFKLVALELATDARPIWEIDFSEPTCIVVGHEDKGVSNAMLNACSEVAFIPQMGKVGSLNVATAAAMALYEARRQGFARSTL